MKTNKKKTAITPPFKKIVIKCNYKDFNHFYDTNKNLIYKSIVDLFKEFKKTRKRSLCLYVTAKIQDLVWDTEFNFKKEECFILKRDVMPYFENIEDYETCNEILKLHDELTCSK